MTDPDYKFKYVKGLIEPAEYLRQEIAAHGLDGLGTRFGKVKQHLSKTFEDAFWELNELSREHPFWHNTNNLPTFQKVREYSIYRLDQGEDVSKSAQILITCNYLISAGFLELEIWQHLKNGSIIDCELLIMMAWLDSGYWPHLNVAPLVSIIIDFGLREQILPYLDKLEQFGSDEKEWVDLVKNELKKDNKAN